MIEFKSLREELKNILSEILSYKQKEVVHPENIEFTLHKIAEDLANKISSIRREICRENLLKAIEQFTSSEFTDKVKGVCEQTRTEQIKKIKTHRVDDILTSHEFKEKFINELREIRELSKAMERECDKLSEIIEKIIEEKTFAGREGEYLKKLREKINELKRAYNEIREESNNLITDLKENQKTLVIPPEIRYLVRSLELRGEVWTHEIVEKVSGLRNIAGEPYTEEVKIQAPGEEFSLTIDQLLTRYPPFEPIQKEFEGITGRLIWFLEPNNAIFVKPENILSKISRYVEMDEEKLTSAKLLDILKDAQGGAITVRIWTGSRNIFVKYGSEKLANALTNALKRKSLNEVFKELQNEYKRVYSVSNLGYVWYCILGLGMSTDPYDFECPFMQYCPVGKNKHKCDKWSWRRRLFPKVYVIPERKLVLAYATDRKRGQSLPFMTPFAASGVRMYELYRRAQWYMPSVTPEGPIVEVAFKKSLRKDLPKTNVIGFEIPLLVVKAIIKSLLDEKVPGKPEVNVIYGSNYNYSVSLKKLLLSKFFVYKMTKRGSDTFSFLQMKDDKLIEKFRKLSQELQRSSDEVVNFAINVLGHTLAHLFHSYVSNALEIEPENLLYVYEVDEEKGVLVVAIAENSAWGSLNIVKHAEVKFGSVDRMVEEFVDSIAKFLKNHKKQIQSYYTTGSRRVTIDPKVSEIADKLRDKYMNLVNNGIILDVVTFLNHIVISGQDDEIARELQLSVRELRERLTDAVVVSGISTCIDGCAACVMLDHGCTAPLVQNVILSRNLTAWILRVLTRKATVKGRGDVLGPAIFYQAKEWLFAFSPYLDEEGVKILTELAQRGVKVILVTRKEFAERFGEQLKKHGIKVCITKTPRHDKFYIIDKRVCVRTTQNLSGLSSVNEFSFEQLKPEEAESIVRQELKSDLVECYGES
jgi:hypothetical protein